MTEGYEFLYKLGLSLLVGMLIGIDRQLKNKPLGVKTSMVISIASCLLTMVSIDSVHKFSIPGSTNMDPMRLAAQVVSGVGFLGAGVILRRSNDVISGLTTASLVWAASGLGIAVGAGFYIEAISAMMLIIIAINVFSYFIKWIGPSTLRQRDLAIKILIHKNQELNFIFKQIKGLDMKINRVKVKDTERGYVQLEMTIFAQENLYTTDIYTLLTELKDVVSVEVESR